MRSRLAMYARTLSVVTLILIYMMMLSEAFEPPTAYYGSTVDPAVIELTKQCNISTDSVPAVSPSQYNSLVSDIKTIFNLSWWLHDSSRKHYNNAVPNICHQAITGLLPEKYRMVSHEPSTDEFVLPRIVQGYYVLGKFIAKLGQILLNETANGIVLEHSFADQVFEIYQLSYTATVTIRKILLKEGLGCLTDENPSIMPTNEAFDVCPIRFVNLAGTSWDYYLLTYSLYQDLIFHQINRAALYIGCDNDDQTC